MSTPLARRLLAAGLALAAVCGGCDAVAHIKAIQPPAVRGVPAVTSSAAPGTQGGFQRGIDIDVYTWPGENFAAPAADTVRYIAGLHANAVSVSFPFFMDGTRSGSVHATSGTPTPAQLALLTADARNAGLRVTLRPLLDQGSLGTSRVRWIPADEAAWFRSYERFLRPYAQMAQQDHVSEFIVGTELAGFTLSPRWNRLDRYLRRYFAGPLACSDNWDAVVTRGCGRSAAQQVDAYPAVASASRISATWTAFDRALPRGVVESEVGIAAARGAWRMPWQARWPVRQTDPALQARWFADACRAAVAARLGGIYFWSSGFSTTAPRGPTLASQTTWAGGPAAKAISACFASIERTGR